MAMHSEGKIYLGVAVLGVALTAYVVERLFVLIQHPFASIDLAFIGAVAIALFALSAFYATVAFVFAARFVVRIKGERDSLVLCRSDDRSIQVNGDVRVIRRFGKQFSSNENRRAFVLFIANGRLWVTPQQDSESGV